MKLTRNLIFLAAVAIGLVTVGSLWFTQTEAQRASSTPRLVSGRKEPPGRPENMVWIPGGEFWMGGPSKAQTRQAADDVRSGFAVCRGLVDGFPDAEPQVRVHVDGFWMD